VKRVSSSLALLSCSESRGSDVNLAKLAEMMGVGVVTFEVTDAQAAEDLLATVRGQGHRTVAAHSETLARLKCQARQSGSSAASLLEGFEHAFIYGFEESGRGDLAAWLTDRLLCRPTQFDGKAREYSISASAPEICGQLSGLALPVDGRARGFVTGQPDFLTSRVAGIIIAQERPFFAVARQGDCEVFLLAYPDMLDIDAGAAPGDVRPEHYASLLPPLMFLRYAFGDYCWKNPTPRATLIIDDPLLRPHYGFLAFDQLIAEMEAHRFAGTIAFIPWNYRRSSRRVTDMLRKHRDRFSICVHGCDHTGGEFVSRDEALLRSKARTALCRSRWHEDISGLACDPVMVFPQGGFTTTALGALKAEGYVGAVNTSVFPDGWRPGELTIKDLLDVAVTRYGGFPLFGRRYPRSLLPFALDLFMGKPALIAEHHEYFRDGYTAVCEFVARMNALDPLLSWQPLNQTLIGSALYKRTGQRTARTAFYTDKFALSNPYGEAMTFRISKKIGSNDSLKYVLRDGVPFEHRVTANAVEAELELEPNGHAIIDVVRGNAYAQTDVTNRLTYKVEVAMRRYLSEFRDNHLARSPRLVAFSKKLARLMPV
jgi:hypothetical protein